jgi:hypothetical protein
MILLRKPGLLFIKGAKVAGSSIEAYLARFAGDDDILTPIVPPPPGHRPRNYERCGGVPLYNHVDAATVRQALGPGYFDALRRFGVVRDPVEKVKSTFAMQYVLNEGAYDLDRAIDDTWSEAQKYCDADGSLLLTDVIRYERLEQELRPVLAAAGIPFERLDVGEKTGFKARCPMSPDFTPAQFARLARKFAWEFERYYPEELSRYRVRYAELRPDAAESRDAARDSLVQWHPEPGSLSVQNLDTWYLGGTVHRIPPKERYDVASVLEGWVPEAPLIRESTRVIGIGSCFARYFILWLGENGFNRGLEGSPYNALMKYGETFESPAVIAQQLRWAFDELDPQDVLWIGKDREVFQPTEDRRRMVRETLLSTDLLIVTLGLSEVWYDQRSGEPLWRTLTRRHYDPSRHVFRVESARDTKRWLEKIEEIRRRRLPHLRIVYTVSPVRLAATFRPVSAVTANSASKAILRASLDEFLREQGDRLNRELFYFPSYELVHDYFRDPFEEDNRHVTSFVAARVVSTFARYYCAPELLSRAGAAAPTGSTKLDSFLEFTRDGSDPRSSEYAARIADLEAQVQALQRECDQRMQVIGELDTAARERLALVEQLHEECARLRRKAGAR